MAESAQNIQTQKPLGRGLRTHRTAVASVAMILVSVLWNEWMPYYTSGSNISRSHFPVALFYPFLILCICNLLANHRRSTYALTRSELLVVMASGLVGISVSYDGTSGHLIGVIAAPYYFASTENGWTTYLLEHIPHWQVPTNAGGEMTRFYEGGQGTFPWRVWVAPIFWWTCFLGAMGFAVFSVVVILRKQWVDYERLAYPLVEVGSLLTETEPGGTLEKMLRSPLFWIAFGLVMALKLWNIGSYFSPAFPHISIEGMNWRAFPDFPALPFRLSFYAIGFGYFARLDVLFSVWFFIVLTAFQIYASNIFGYPLGSSSLHWENELLNWQSMGALIFLAVWGLWMARAHLKAVWRKAWDPSCEIDDRGELLSYRTAVFGLVLSLVFATYWLVATGMALWVAIVFLILAMLLFLGLARAVSELGLVYAYYRLEPNDAVVQAFGSASIMGVSSITALAFMRVFNFFPDIGKGFLMPSFSQAVKAVDKTVAPRRITGVIWASLAVGFVISIVNTLYLSYEYGAYNLGNMGLKNVGPRAFDFAMNAIRNPLGLGGDGRVMWAGVGAGTMAILTLIRYWIPAWPLHPIGLAMQGNYGVSKTVFSVFIVWSIKVVVMKMGGVQLYEKGKPFFIGLLAAQAFSTGLVFVIDCIWFPLQGHNVHNF